MDGIEYGHDHAAVSVPRLAASIDWYCRVLGFAVERRVVLESLQARVAILINGGLRIELFEVPGARPPSEDRAMPDADLQTFGNKHVAFATADIEAVHAQLVDRGADIVWMRRFAFGTNIFLRDNAGNLIEFVQRAGTHLGMASLQPKTFHSIDNGNSMHINFNRQARVGLDAARASLASLALAIAATTALAQEPTFPDKSIHIVVSVPAGGGIDALARVLGEGLSKRTGKATLVENKPGATGAIAIQYVLKQPADGVTLYLAPDAAHTFVPLIKKMPYRALDDFTFIARVAYTPNIVAVANKIPAKTLKDFVALAKASPGKFNYGTMLGIPAQMDFELFKRGTGTDIVSVPYTGGATIATGMLDGSIDVTLFPVTPFSQQIKGGKIRALAVTSNKRLASMPDVPTVAEAGFGQLGLAEGGYFGLVGPAGMPVPVVAKLRALVGSILSDPEFRDKIAVYDFETALMDGEAYKQILVRQLADNEKLVKSLNIKFE